ncbi:MAG: hypothetical protein ABJH05_08835 [Fulvivirga sp.]
MNFEYEIKDGYVHIKTQGARNSLIDIVNGTARIYEIMKQKNIYYFLLDYRKVDFNVTRIEAFNIVRHFETHFPDLVQASLSMVVNEKSFDVVKYWETICQQRDFNNKVFIDIEEASGWLQSLIP